MRAQPTHAPLLGTRAIVVVVVARRLVAFWLANSIPKLVEITIRRALVAISPVVSACRDVADRVAYAIAQVALETAFCALAGTKIPIALKIVALRLTDSIELMYWRASRRTEAVSVVEIARAGGVALFIAHVVLLFGQRASVRTIAFGQIAVVFASLESAPRGAPELRA